MTKKSRVKKPGTRTRIKTGNPFTKSKVVQSERHFSDINHIVSKAYQTGQLPVLNRQAIDDFPSEMSYQDALNKTTFANQKFMQLPATIRDEFNNDPAKMLAAVEASKKDDKLKTQLQNLGILNQPDPMPSKEVVVEQTEGETTAE